MKQTKQFLRPLLMAIVMLVGMLVPKGAWAQKILDVDDYMTITEDCSYEDIFNNGSTLIISEGVKVQVEDPFYIDGIVINYGTIIGDVEVYGGTFANHGHVTMVAVHEGIFYNTGTYDDLMMGSATQCSHELTTETGVQVAATCTHGAGPQFECEYCHYIGVAAEGDPLPHEFHDHNGLKVCSMCGQMTFDAPTVGDGTAENPYQIANAGHLYWFADKVNNDYDNFKDANAVLTADIVVNDGTFAANGAFTATGASGTSTPIEWLVIARFDLSSYGYRGTFDGQGHTISGLYANYSFSGLIGRTAGECKIKNVGVINSYFAGIDNVGGICGNAGNNTEISNCYSNNVICKGPYVGGIVGAALFTGVSIINCYSSSLINQCDDDDSAGGIAGWISGSTTNCYTTYGNVNGSSRTAPVNCEANVSLGRFASGEIAWLLNGSVDGEGNWTAGATDGTQKWYQKIGTMMVVGDSYPVLAAAEGNTVYGGYESCASEDMDYSNSVLYATKEEAPHDFTLLTLSDVPDANGLYTYICDRCDAPGDYHVVKANNASEGESATIELTPTTVGGTTTYTAAAPVAVPDGAFSTPVDFTATGGQVSIDRTFTTGTPATINLPFDVEASAMSETYYTFGGIEQNSEGKWVATMEPATGTLTANTPYIVMPTGTSISIGSSATVSFKANASANSTTTSGDWKMTAAKAPKTWATGDEELGKAYGFAANSGTAANGEAVAAGQFVMVAAGASIAAGRAYLKYTGETSPFTRAADAQLPASISVIFKHADATGIGTLNTETGAFTFDGWYDLQGRRISEPAKGGVIMNNNKKIIVK